MALPKPASEPDHDEVAASLEGNPPPPSPDGTGAVGKRETELRQEPNRLRRALKILGPGFITGASDDDPSGIGTYASAGASLGFAPLWLALFSFPLMAAVQYICAKVGLQSGMGLAGVLRRNYSRKLLYPTVVALMIANTINVGADIGAIAAGINLLVPIPIPAMILPIALLILILLVWGSYGLISTIFKWLALALLAYVGAAFLARPDPMEVLRSTFVPTISTDSAFMAAVVAILGTTISPYLFFWQASQEVEEKVTLGRMRLWQRRGTSDTELKYAAWDVNVGMLFSNLVMYFIILGTAATLFKSGQTNIGSAADAAKALQPLAGDAATILFAFGMIATGFLAIPVLAGSSAYAVSEAFGWKYGLDEPPVRALQFYGVIVASAMVGTEINYLGINPIDALVWTAVINGVVAPPLLVLIMMVANNRKIMGERVNNRVTNVLGWIATAVMFAAVIGLVLTWGK